MGELIMIDRDRQVIDEIVDNLLAAIPVIHRKLINSLDEGLGLGISHHHFAVLGLLSRHGALPVSELGKRLWISRPQMTAVTDKLVGMQLVERKPDSVDRRVIHVALTPAGQAVLNRGQQVLVAGIVQKAAGLSERDLVELAESLKNINRIGAKIE
jgi:DNA-binding MarR family transcriptional regulator